MTFCCYPVNKTDTDFITNINGNGKKVVVDNSLSEKCCPIADLPTPDKGKSGDPYKKNREIVQETLRFDLFPDQD